jgi:CRISPR-associated protein Cas2
MQGSRWWLVCYDIHDSKRLRHTARHLLGYGERVQYSIFRCWLTPREMQQLRWELTELLDPVDDVLFIPLCAVCVAGMAGTHLDGQKKTWPDEPDRFRII